MKEWVIYYYCPNCKNPDCGADPMGKANEIVEARTKTDAIRFFNTHKQCRSMKVFAVKEYNAKPTFAIIEG